MNRFGGQYLHIAVPKESRVERESQPARTTKHSIVLHEIAEIKLNKILNSKKKVEVHGELQCKSPRLIMMIGVDRSSRF